MPRSLVTDALFSVSTASFCFAAGALAGINDAVDIQDVIVAVIVGIGFLVGLVSYGDTNE